MTSPTATVPPQDMIHTPADEAIPVLNLSDTCDPCGYVIERAPNGVYYHQPVSTAYVRVQVSDGSYLDMCGHHFRRHETAILAAGYPVRDERHRLDA